MGLLWNAVSIKTLVYAWCVWAWLEDMRSFRIRNLPPPRGYPDNPFNDPIWYSRCVQDASEHACNVVAANHLNNKGSWRPLRPRQDLATPHRAIVTLTLRFASLVACTARLWSVGWIDASQSECTALALVLTCAASLIRWSVR